MSTKAVIIALVVALLLGIGAYLVLQPSPKPSAKADVFNTGDLVCKIDSQAVNAIEIESPNGEVQRIERAAGGVGGFTLTISRQSALVGPAWAIEEGRVGNLIRVLNDVRSLNPPDDQTEMDADAIRVTIREDGGKVTHLLLGGRTLGGRGLVRVVDGAGKERLSLSELRAQPGRLAMIDDSIHSVFRNPGPRAWRDTLALQGVGPEVSRLTLANNDLSLRLARLEGKWTLQAPIPAPADPAPVNRLINTLAAIHITSFLDEPNAPTPTDADTGLAKPLASIVAETDRRVIEADPSRPGGDVIVKTETRELEIGNPADAAAETRYARLGNNGPVVIISGAGLTRELFEATNYVSRKAVQAPAGDIGMLVIESTSDTSAAPHVFRKDLDKWKEVTATDESTLDEAMTKAVEELIRFLTAEDARSLSIAPPAVWRDQASIVVGSLSGTPIETLTLGASEGADLCIRIGEGKNAVHRWYQRDRVPRLLVPLLPKPPEAVKVPDAEGDIK